MEGKESYKRPKLVKYFNFEENQIVHVDEVDSFQMISMIFGVVAFILKYKFSIWISLTFFLANYNQQKIGIPQGKYVMNFCLLTLSFLLIYIFPS